MNKTLVLCSGGFDSILLLHTIVSNSNVGDEIHTLFFNYGQKSVNLERACVLKACDELDCIFHEILLPRFHWTAGEFYSEKFSGSGEYLEMRNLIFISYALSLCESLGIDHLCMAILKSYGYYDTSYKFLSKVRSIAFDKGIHFDTPFSLFEKEDLMSLAFRRALRSDDFHSCDNPVDNKPCGECPDCQALKEIFKVLDNFTSNPIDL